MSIQQGIYLGANSSKVGLNIKLAGAVCGLEVQEFGPCTITTRTQPTCSPDCAGGQNCSWSADCSVGECVDPVATHAGEITITGATHQDPVTCSHNGTQYECDANIEQHLFEPGDSLQVVATGAAFPAFDYTVTAPPDHSFTTATDSWTAATFDGSADVLLEWTTAETAHEYKLTLKTSSSNQSLVCHFSDTGSFTIPAAGIDALDEPVTQVDIHRQNKYVFNEGETQGEMTIVTVIGAALPIGESCLVCSQYIQACQTACPEITEVCEGPARDAATALVDCFCAECTAECELTCSGTGTDSASCQSCRSSAMSGPCSAQRSTCQAN